MLNSDELLLVQSIAKRKRLDLAARDLGVNHSTLFRKLQELETRVSGALFVKAKGDYQCTPLGQVCCQAAEQWSAQQQNLRDALQAVQSGQQSPLRITTTEDAAMVWLPQCLSRCAQMLSAKNQRLTVDVLIDEDEWDLARDPADVSIRPTRAPPQGWVGMDLGPVHMGLYAAREVAEQWRDPARRAAIPWIMRHPGSGPAADREWMQKNLPAGSQCLRTTRASALGEATKLGLGIALLPVMVGLALQLELLEPVRLGEQVARLWMLTHPDRKRDPRIRTLFAAARTLPKLRAT
jgi:DNA-binding transcriptional LysR family regulator